VPQAECQALLDLYLGTNGDNPVDAPTWTKKDNWFTTTDVDDRWGVRTAMYNGQRHVDGLYFNSTATDTQHNLFVQNIQGNNMDGSLAASI
jgi:hypothetical protein